MSNKADSRIHMSGLLEPEGVVDRLKAQVAQLVSALEIVNMEAGEYYKDHLSQCWERLDAFDKSVDYLVEWIKMSRNNTYMSNRVSQMKQVQEEALQLFSKKNKDYGDSFATFGSIGVIMRMGDKLHRLMSIEKNKITLVNDESIRDTLIDLHNYSAMAIMLLDETK